MSTDTLKESVREALRHVVHPESGEDIVAAGHIENLSVGESGDVRFSFMLGPNDPGSLVKQAREAVEGLGGVESVKVNVELPRSAPPEPPPAPRPSGLKPGSVPAPTPKPGLLPNVDRVIAVSSGKGGVGKSMVASNIAAALARTGKRVGLLDADIYGPNIPLMFGEQRRPKVTGQKGSEQIEPLEAHGVTLMSLGFLLDKEQPAIMRGPLIAGILRQFLEQVSWGDLDVLVVDMPPGTGDAQLSLVQTIDVAGAVMVTTPQQVSTGDVRRAIKMFERVNTPVLGIVENMAGYLCPHCGEIVEIFGMGGGEELAEEMNIAFLGRVPLDPEVARSGDAGVPTAVGAPDSPAGSALRELAERVLAATE